MKWAPNMSLSDQIQHVHKLALSLAAEAKESAIVEIDKDCICHTINGKPVKPKTLGQKNYVDAIRQKMIVFGMGPAGTGKTYLAMAMAITAFKNGVGPLWNQSGVGAAGL